MIQRNEQLQAQLAELRKMLTLSQEQNSASSTEAILAENEAIAKRIQLTQELAQAQALLRPQQPTQQQAQQRRAQGDGFGDAAPIGGDTGSKGAKLGGLRLQFFTNDGTMTWSSWRIHYMNIVDMMEDITEMQAMKLLKGSMLNDAADTVSDLTVHMYTKAEEMLEAFGERFQPQAAQALAQTQYETARQGPSETLLAFHNRLKKLFKNAFPQRCDQWNSDKDLMKRFITGIRDTTTRLDTDKFITLMKLADYAEVLQTAQSLVSVQHREDFYHKGGKKLTTLSAEYQPTTSTNGKTNGTTEQPMEIGALQGGDRKSTRKCRYAPCGQTGHWKEDCHKYLQMKVRTLPHLFQNLQVNQNGASAYPSNNQRGRGSYSNFPTNSSRGSYSNSSYSSTRGSRGGFRGRGRGPRYVVNAMGEIEGVLDEDEEEQQQAQEQQEESQDAWARVAEMRETEEAPEHEAEQQAEQQQYQQYPDFQ